MIRYLAAALLAAPALAADDPPRIMVTGAATVSLPPDVAAISYVVHGEGATSDEAVAARDARRRAIERGLASMGATEPRASNIQVAEVRSRECNTNNYAPRLSTGACAIVGYVADLQIELRTGKVKDAATLVGLIGRLGGANPRLNGFFLADADQARRQALAAALADARQDAEALAKAAGATLGPLISASDGSFPNAAQEIVVTGSRISAPPPPPPPPPPIAVEITPRAIETQARVTVVYGLVR